MADDVISLKINLEANTANMTLQELEDHFEAMKTKLKGIGRGDAEFQKLSNAMARTTAEIKNIEIGFEGLDRTQIASELGAVAGGISAITASLILMGGENETMREMGQSIQAALAITMGVKGAIEAGTAANKLYTNSVKAQSIATKGAAFMQGILNAVMSLNPIGLVVIAVIALVAAFVYMGDTMKKILKVAFWPFFLAVEAGIYIWNNFKDTILNILKVAFAPLLLTIRFVTDALKALGIMESDTAKATRLAGDEKIKSYKKQADELAKLRDAHDKLSKKVIKDLQFELELLKAKGEDVSEAEWQIINEKKKAAKKAKEIAKDEYLNSKKLLDLRRRYGQEIADEDIDAHNALVASVKATAEAYKDAKNDQTIFFANRKRVRKEDRESAAADAAADAKEASDKRTAQREKDEADESKRLIEEAKTLAEFNEEQARIKIQLIQDEGERARAEIKYNSELELEALEKKGQDTFDARMLIAQTKNKALADLEKAEVDKRFALEKEAQAKRDEYDKLLFNAKLANEQEETDKKKLQLEEDYQNNITRLEEEGLLTMELEFELLYTKEQALADIEKEFRDKAAAEKQAQRDKDFALASASIGALSALNKAATDTALLNAAGDEEKKEKIRKASFEREKKLNIAMALINGSQAVLAGFAQGGLLMAIVAGVTAAAQLAAIVATTYQGGGSVKEVDKTAPVEPSGAGAGGAGAQINAVTNTSTILGNQQVYVTETDITTTQNNVSVIEESATF